MAHFGRLLTLSARYRRNSGSVSLRPAPKCIFIIEWRTPKIGVYPLLHKFRIRNVFDFYLNRYKIRIRWRDVELGFLQATSA